MSLLKKKFMTFLSKLVPKFWGQKHRGKRGYKQLVNFKRMWKLTVLLTISFGTIPLFIMAIIDFRIGKESMESEILLRTSRLVSNTRRTIAYFLDERKSALNYVNRNETFNNLVSKKYLKRILSNLEKSFGGFIDLGVINDRGIQISYAGPYDLQGKNYGESNWFKEVVEKSVYISDVYMGFRNIPHMVIATKHRLKNGGYYVLRATLDTSKFNDILSGLVIGGDGDAFLINRDGIVQTPSRYHGYIFDKIDIPIPEFSQRSHVKESSSKIGEPVILGYAFIENTPFILIIIKNKALLMAPWRESRLQILSFLILSIFFIVIVVLGGISYLVNQIFHADQHRLLAIRQAEYSNKMASLGQLSAGIAHEINNPLAIIREKAGLINDIFAFNEKYSEDSKLTKLIDSIISSVDRCAEITWRLLGFARHSHIKIRSVNLNQIINEVLSFLDKEARYRSISIKIDIPNEVSTIVSDYGRLQEIFLNLITNAFAAVSDNGLIEIKASKTSNDMVRLTFTDNGHGIPESDLALIFEPFFSTKLGSGGSGLGLSITYRLVEEADVDPKIINILNEDIYKILQAIGLLETPGQTPF